MSKKSQKKAKSKKQVAQTEKVAAPSSDQTNKSAAEVVSDSSVAESNPKKPGKFKRLIRNKIFWGVVITLVVLFGFLGWLFSNYEPPFPPHWIGVEYYSFAAEQPLALDQLNALNESLKTIQTAVLVFEPISPGAKRLLPPEFMVSTFTLSDVPALKVLLADSLAQKLSGIDQTDRAAAQQILANPAAAVALKQIAVAMTDSPNATSQEQVFNEKISAQGKLMAPEAFDTIQDKVMLAAPIKPATSTASAISANIVQVDKHSAYYLYQDEAAKAASASAALRQPYDGFSTINNALIPTRGGRSPLLSLNPGQYQLAPGAVLMPVTYYFAVQTVEGMPYNTKSVGHGWTSVSRDENGRMYPIMTFSLFNFIDDDNLQNVDRGELTNVATYTNLWVNHTDDWVRSTKSLNHVPLPDGPSRSDLNEISPETARKIIMLRSWYMPNYSTQDQYMQYLQDSFYKSTDWTNKLALLIEMGQVKIQNVMNESFWGAIQIWMNGGYSETSYNGVTANCVAYSTDLWNALGETPFYDPRMLKLVAVPGKLYHDMVPDEVIDLPDAETLPLDQQNVPYNPANY